MSLNMPEVTAERGNMQRLSRANDLCYSSWAHILFENVSMARSNGHPDKLAQSYQADSFKSSFSLDLSSWLVVAGPPGTSFEIRIVHTQRLKRRPMASSLECSYSPSDALPFCLVQVIRCSVYRLSASHLETRVLLIVGRLRVDVTTAVMPGPKQRRHLCLLDRLISLQVLLLH